MWQTTPSATTAANLEDAALPTANKRELTKLRNRQAILDAARVVFVEIGYDAATVRDIIGRTGLAPGTFYNYFPDKHSILVAIANDIGNECRSLLRKARHEADSLESLVHNGFHAYFSFIAGDRTLFELLRRNASVLRRIGMDETGFSAGVDELRADINAAIAAGHVPAIPLDYLVPAIGALAFEVGAQMVNQDPPDVEGATRFCVTLCLSGISGLIAGAAR